jgi:hypothetical protein
MKDVINKIPDIEMPQLKKFRIKADFVFEAEDIDDALNELYHYFNNLRKCPVSDSDDWDIIKNGDLEIKKEK